MRGDRFLSSIFTRILRHLHHTLYRTLYHNAIAVNLIVLQPLQCYDEESQFDCSGYDAIVKSRNRIAVATMLVQSVTIALQSLTLPFQ